MLMEPEFRLRFCEEDTELRFRFQVRVATLRPMAAVETRPKRADARRNHERILKAAHTAFSELGADVQMDEIARSAGVGVGTLYRHFPTKEVLINELAREIVAAIIEFADQALERDDPWEAIELLMRRNAADMARHAGLRDTFTIHFTDESPFDNEELQARIAELVDRAQSAGVLRPEVTPQRLQALACGLSGTIAQIPADWELFADVLLDGLRAR
jgi:AcrR family transcriptional regulator